MTIAATLITACSDDETYADQKERERNAISRFIAANGIKTISMEQFLAQDSTTDTTKNEYVLFNDEGVYMQIVRKGGGRKIQDGENATVLCRFTEWNISDNDSTEQTSSNIMLSDNNNYYSSTPEKMNVSNSSGTFTASFESPSLMNNTYGSSAVPSGWLVPLTYINIGTMFDSEGDIAKVKLIVPHTAGQTYATQNVIPCFYEITYQRGR